MLEIPVIVVYKWVGAIFLAMLESEEFYIRDCCCLWLFQKYFQPLGQINAVWNLWTCGTLCQCIHSHGARISADQIITLLSMLRFFNCELIWEWMIDPPQQNLISTVCMKFGSPMWLDSTSECELVKNLAACRWYELHMQPTFQGAQLSIVLQSKADGSWMVTFLTCPLLLGYETDNKYEMVSKSKSSP